MMIDIDLFKNINDNFGHATGDRTIKLVAQVLSKQLRSNDIIGRVGGEEYAALLVDIDQHTAFKIAQRLCEQVAKQLRFIGKDEVEVTISIGMAQLKPANYSYEAALKAADIALYASKESGRNTVSIGKIVEE
jgi:diguanylate cyclase (GGDEF)-like protein